MRALKLFLAMMLVCGAASAAVTITTEAGFSPQGDQHRYTKFSLSTAETSAWFLINAGDTVAVLTGGGTCKAQFAAGLPSEVTAVTAVAIDWAPGAVTVPTAFYSQWPMRAVRFVSSAGACIGMVVQRNTRR